MKTSRDKSLTFAKRIVGNWRDPTCVDCASYQKYFLYINAFGAHETAKSYWILHKNKRFSDCLGLARNLLERIVNGICGSKSPTQAVELISHELSDKIRRAKLWKPSPNISPQLNASIKEHEKILPVFLRLLGISEAPDWNWKKRFDEAGLPSFYRSAYFNFSRYAHAGYEVPRPGKRNQLSKAADFIALVAPVLTAANYHAVNCPNCQRGKCDLLSNSMALLHYFSARTLGKTNQAVRKRKST
jgi:hypothetical protein